MNQMLLFNGSIHTLDPRFPQVSALVVLGERIAACGTDREILAEYGTTATKMDLGGKAVIPGLVDAHIHLEHYAMGLQKVDCETRTMQECLERVAERARGTAPGTWILGHGWNQNDWEAGFGHAADLDAAAPHHPVFLTAKSLHAAWANTAALRQAQITSSTPDPPAGRLGRYSDGSPDGLLFEAAMQLVESAIPEPSLEQIVRALRAAQPVLWRMGLTGVHDFDRRRCFQALQTLNSEHEFRLRVIKSIPLEDLPHAVEIGLRSGFGNDFLRIGSVKIFSDGALGPRTAAMLEPFEGEPDNRGMLFLDGEELFEHGRMAAEAGFSLAVHAIGDRANHEVLNAFAQLREFERQKLPGRQPLRHRIEHVQLLHPADAGRLAELDVIASMQPIHATSDMNMADRFWGQRTAYAYASRLQLQHGAHLAFGSDAPVESPNPFWGLHAAVTRQRMDGAPGSQGWHPEQRLSVQQALEAYTRGPAYAAGMEDRLGCLAPGFLADLLVLDADPFECPAEELSALQPLATMIAGEWVYQSDRMGN